jgi:hypothetical protein
MRPINRTAILTRSSLCLVATAFIAVPALAAAPVARAEWDIQAYDQCIAIGRFWGDCCKESGGAYSSDYRKCVAPASVQQSFPPPPPRPGPPAQAPNQGHSP